MASARRPEGRDRRRRSEGGRGGGEPAGSSRDRRERLGSPRARLFVALDLPEHVRDAIAAWRDGPVAGRADLRPVAAAALHVTLCFLGWRAEREVARIADETASACAGASPPRLVARGLEPVPSRQPRLFALDLDDASGEASALQAAVSARLAAARMYEPERRPFWPHVTLARVKRGVRAEPLVAPPPPAEPFEAVVVTLYRSTLRPQGALYEPLARTTLEG